MPFVTRYHKMMSVCQRWYDLFLETHRPCNDVGIGETVAFDTKNVEMRYCEVDYANGLVKICYLMEPKTTIKAYVLCKIFGGRGTIASDDDTLMYRSSLG